MESMAHATYEDLLRVPQNMVAELIEGEIYASSRPGYRHANAASELLTILRWHLGRPGRGEWHVVFEPELHLGGNVLGPDLAGWRVERVPVMSDTVAIEIVPDWVCEVTSPASGRLDRLRKIPAYSRSDVGYAWLLNPEQQMVEVYRRYGDGWIVKTYGEELATRIEPFEAIEIDLTLIWGPLRA
jgi:Uma2 family endonuclease